MNGNLSTRPFGVLLADLRQGSKSGILTLSRKDIRKQICLLRGDIRFAASNIRAEGFGAFLVRQGVLSEEEVAAAEAELSPPRRLGPHLVEMGLLTMDAIRDTSRAHIIQILFPCLDWNEGQYHFAEGVPRIAGEAHVEVVPLELALERGRRRDDTALQSKLKLSRKAPLRRAKETTADIGQLELSDAERKVLEGADRHLTVSEAALRAGSEEEGLLAIAALIEAGILQLASVESARTSNRAQGGRGEAAGGRLSHKEERTLAHFKDILVNSEGADHYQILKVATTATEEDVRRAYYGLARDLHPDRFAAPPLDILRSEMEVLFARITEAYNVLSEPGSRADYEALRAPVAPPTGSAPAPEPTVSQSPQELARLNYLRGKASVDQQKFVESLKFLENAVSLDPARPEYRLLLGLVQARNPHGRVEAIETLSMAARLDPTNVKVRMEIARLCRRGGDDVAAERWLREVLSIDPNHAEAREGLGENAGSGLLRGLFGRGERR